MAGCLAWTGFCFLGFFWLWLHGRGPATAANSPCPSGSSDERPRVVCPYGCLRVVHKWRLGCVRGCLASPRWSTCYRVSSALSLLLEEVALWADRKLRFPSGGCGCTSVPGGSWGGLRPTPLVRGWVCRPLPGSAALGATTGDCELPAVLRLTSSPTGRLEV